MTRLTFLTCAIRLALHIAPKAVKEVQITQAQWEMME